jgi:D-alanyl-D-alanine carboxypeptidase/D-alanyl-D-alanine-endopeptidase (penicillin-binding protein 4)
VNRVAPVLVAAGFAAALSVLALPALATPDRALGANFPHPSATGAPWSRAARAHLARAIDALLAGAPALRGAHVGFYALDTVHGDILYTRAPDDAFVPASTLKLITGSYALARLGPAFQFQTTAYVDRHTGTLTVRGSGDPLIDGEILMQLARAVRAAGVTRLPGGVQLDAGAIVSEPYPPGWAWDDLTAAYAAPRSSLTYDENARDDGAEPLPDEAFVSTLDDALHTAGVDVTRSMQSGSAPAAAQLVWTYNGEPLGDLLADCWIPSDNFIAEQLLLALGAASPAVSTPDGPGSITVRALAAEGTWLATLGIPGDAYTIVDGSGLSSYDRLTPRELTTVLQADWQTPQRVVVIDDLALAGVRGTLQAKFAGTPAVGHVFAKTGSMNHTRAMAGYLATVRHGAVTFALLVDDWMGSDADLDQLRAAVFSRLITG